MKKNCKANTFFSSGQTLIETLAAAFILVSGVAASVGLAIYAFNSSTSIVKQIVATGLAREGLEAIRNMRDSNWLQDTLVTNGCYDFTSNPVGQTTASCYKNWLGANGNNNFYCIDPSSGNGSNCNGNQTTVDYHLGFDTTSSLTWVIKKDAANYGLSFNNPGSSNTWQTVGFYSPGSNNAGVSCATGGSSYCRQITVTKINNLAPYNTGDASLILLYVQSKVWWQNKRCPSALTQSFDTVIGSCKLELDSYLTNWKNF